MPLVRQATLDDQQAIFAFLHLAYPDRVQYKIPDRWNWQFRNSPFWSERDLPIWIAVDEGRVVGQTGAMVEPLKFGDATHTVAWSVDTYVLPEYRGQGIGRQLQQANQSHHRLFMSLAMSEGNRRIKTSLGAKALDSVRVYEVRMALLNARVRSCLRRFSGSIAAAAETLRIDRMTATVGSRILKRRWLQAANPTHDRPDDIRFCEIDRFDARFDDFWSQMRTHYDIAVERTSRYLNWKFCDQPNVQYRRFTIDQSGQLQGYVVLRKCTSPEPSHGIIADFVTRPEHPDLAAQAIFVAAEELRREGVEKVRLATTSTAHNQMLKRLGFRLTRRYTPMCYTAELAVPDSPRILFGLGDHDLDQFPRMK